VRRAWKALYLSLLAAWFLALGAELALQVRRRLAAPEVERFAREVVEPRDSSAITDQESIWAERYVRYRPGATLELPKPGGAQQLRINSLGFRGAEIRVPKPPGTLRVACLGASTTVQGPRDDATYPARLEAKLRERHPGLAIEVLNLGVSATWSDYWLERSDALFALEPDVLLQYDGINDVAFVHLHHWAEARPWRRTLYRSILAQRLWPPDPAAFDPLFEVTLRNQLRLFRRARERGVAYVTASFATPDPQRLSAPERRFLDHDVDRLWGRALGISDYAAFHALVERYDGLFAERMRRQGVPHLLLHRELADPALFTDVCHLTTRGLDALAEAWLPAVESALAAARGAR
jgi:lysophospholipase L1-like esterase